jgi:hypothetical protein
VLPPVPPLHRRVARKVITIGKDIARPVWHRVRAYLP